MRSILALAILLFGLGAAQAAWIPVSIFSPEQSSEPQSEQPVSPETPEEDANGNPVLAFVHTYAEIIDLLSTVVIAAFTVILGVATVRLWRSTDRLREAGDEQAKISNKLAGAAEQQVAILAAQTDIQNKQHKIGRLQFIAAHRPRFSIRHITIEVEPGNSIASGDALRGTLVVVNNGGTTATIIDARYSIFVSGAGLPRRAPYEIEEPRRLLHFNDEVTAGQSVFMAIDDVAVEGGRLTPGPLRLYVMGQIRYADEGGGVSTVERFMFFCRQLGIDGRFRPVADADYEHQD